MVITIGRKEKRKETFNIIGIGENKSSEHGFRKREREKAGKRRGIGRKTVVSPERKEFHIFS